MDWIPRIKRKIVIEQLLRDENSQIPTDFKFFVFHGKCYMIQVISKRFIDAEISHYDRDFNYLDVGLKKGHFKKGKMVRKPDNFNAMLNLAEFLASPFDFMRVDLYSVKRHIYVGELTYTPATGRLVYDPRSFDFKMGKQLKLIPEYWYKK